MFSKKIIDSARFLKMPLETQTLYFHLGIRADDDGIVEAYSVMRLVGATEDSLKILVAKGFVTVLNDDLVTHITDWNEHNLIRSDRKVDSIYKDLLLRVVPHAELIEPRERADKKHHGQPMDVQRTTNGQHSIGEDRLGKVSLVEDSIDIMSESPTASLESVIIEEAIKYLNHKAGSNYRASTPKTRTLIKARIKEGFGLQDFHTVIDKKVLLWKNNPKMQGYLRPETLFGTKFESYLNEFVGKGKAMAAQGMVSDKTAQGFDALEEWGNQ